MVKYTLHGDPLSPFTIVVIQSLKEHDLPYDLNLIDLKKHMTRTPEHKKLHPFGKIPILDVVEDDGELLRIHESRAISRYLSIRYASLMPEPKNLPAVARFEEAADVHVNYFLPHVSKYTAEKFVKKGMGFGASNEDVLRETWSLIAGTLDTLDGILATRKYAAGSEFSLVDLWYLPWMWTLVAVEIEEKLFASRPNLKNWWLRISERPVSKDTISIADTATRKFLGATEASEVLLNGKTSGA